MLYCVAIIKSPIVSKCYASCANPLLTHRRVPMWPCLAPRVEAQSMLWKMCQLWEETLLLWSMVSRSGPGVELALLLSLWLHLLLFIPVFCNQLLLQSNHSLLGVWLYQSGRWLSQSSLLLSLSRAVPSYLLHVTNPGTQTNAI